MMKSELAKACATVAAAITVCAAVGCNRPARYAADNLLFVSFDTTRADRLSAYGYGARTSPVVDALAARGVLFERAFTHVPSTLSAHSSMFTGLLPPTHGIRCNGKFRLSEERVTLAELLSAVGFATGAVVGAFPLDSRFGLAQGFDHYDSDFSASAITARRRRGRMDNPGFWIGHRFVDFERGADEVTDAAIAWLDSNAKGSRRWHLFAHYFDPHWPYEPPSPQAEAFESAYDGEIAYTDEHLGRLLARVAALPGRTLIVFTSDHGEGLGEHGEELHNRYVYNSTLHVPLIIALDGTVREGARVKTNVSHVDLMPTVLELLGVEAPSPLQGRSLLPALLEPVELEPRPHYSETLAWNLERPLGIEVRSILDGDHKYVFTQIDKPDRQRERSELYDIGLDFAELIDLGPYDPELTARYRERLQRWSAELERSSAPSEEVEMDEGARERMRSLGYL